MLAFAIPTLSEGRCCAVPSTGNPSATAPSAPLINLRRTMSIAFSSSISVFVHVVAQRLAAVFLAEGAAALQRRDDAIDEVEDVGREQRVADHEAVGARLLDDLAHPVGDLLRRADDRDRGLERLAQT